MSNSEKQIQDVNIDLQNSDSVHYESDVHSRQQLSTLGEDENSINKESNQLSFVNIDPVSVRVRDLSVSAKSENLSSRLKFFKKAKLQDEETPNIKKILHNTSFDLPSGSLMAIIGGSGSGKTTLLNVLANRSSSSSSLAQTGEISFNGYDIQHVRNSYVIQQDILSPNLTTRETLQYATELRLPDSTTKAERLRLVEEVILELGLKDCADTIVGDSSHKGLSGGEKRRLSIGIQLLSNPSLIFLDEPTTGLDAHSAYLLIKTLKNLALRGRTIIISIHQPRSDIFFLFDYLCILSRGKTVYSYKVDHVLEYFSALGYDVPESVNPADFLIDTTAVDVRDATSEKEGIERLLKFDQSWKEYQKHILDDHQLIKPLTNSKKVVSTKAPFWRELTVLTKRTWLLTLRDSVTLLSMLGESIIMGIICGWVYYKPGGSLAGIRTTSGAIYSAAALQGYLMILFETYRLSSKDIKLFDRERADNCVSVTGFLISRRIAKLFTEDLLVSMFYSAICYFMFGLEQSAQKFFIFWLGIFLIHLVAMNSAMFAVSVSRNFAQAGFIGNLNYTLQSFACGFFINASTMPVYVRWTKYITFLWYGFGALIVNQFESYFGDCPYGDETSSACNSYNGKYIIDTYGFWDNWIAVPLIVVLAWAIAFFIAAGIMLEFKKVDVSLSKQIKSAPVENEVEDLEESFTKNPVIDAGNSIDITLNQVFLSVKVKRNKQKGEKVILNNVNALFKSGKINAIMGPSGSGKSSLLNLVSGRLSSDLVNRYSSSGDIVFNDMKVSTKMMNSICSYVSQDDEHLLDSLSVRETFTLAADLRLSLLSVEEKKRVVEDIIGKLGLRNCANTLIGSEFVKGISGGEKRRVSIGIQLLNNPKVLLLDEPTSGLDSFTASTILEILQNLANEGKTIILTIHQPRSDLFKKFGQVLLLSKGGFVGYNGPQLEMMNYFGRLGYPCPRLTNSADHILDLISVNNQTPAKEIHSKERIEFLLSEWRKQPPPRLLSSLKLISEADFEKQFGSYIRRRAGFRVALVSCTRQLTLTTFRNVPVSVNKVFNSLGVGIIIALFTAPLKNNYIGVTNRLGVIQQVTSLYFVGMLNNLATYPAQRNYFYHEHDDRVYGVLPFFLSYFLVELPFEILSGLLTGCFLGPIIGLPRTAAMYFSLVYNIILIIMCGESLGIITNTIFMEAGFAVNTVSVVLSIGTFMAGIMSLNMDSFLKGINYISPLKYALSIVVNMAFPADLHFTCDSSSMDSSGNCIFSNGEQVLQEYGLKAPYEKYFGVLLCVSIIYRIIAYAILRIRLLKIDLGVFSSSTKVE